MVKRLIQHALVLAVLGLGLPQVIQAQDAVNRSFAPLEIRPNDDINMVLIPAGSFYMGSEKNSDEKPRHMVYLQSFLLGKTEVTQRQWQDVMGSNPKLLFQRIEALKPREYLQNPVIQSRLRNVVWT